MRRRARALCTAVLAAAVAVASTGCGYALVGRGNTLPAYVRIIGIPQFVNQSPIENVDVVMTDEVRREFLSRGSFRTQPETEGADAVLRGTILSVYLEPLATNVDRQGSRYTFVVTARIEFVDQHDASKVLWSNPSLRVAEPFDVPADVAAGDPSAVFRQDQNALERLARVFARSVVTAILTGD
ncbi:MAG: LPS assembly lipoprotein LptE [Vicinamibacterales bacterium]